jgi:Development and cell death domain
MYDGYVFLCNTTSQQQCLSNKRYVCTDKESQPPQPIKEGSVIFLYNPDDKSLLGPFTSLIEGGAKLDAGTWGMYTEKHIPSEDIKVTWEDLHIIRNAEADLPFLAEFKTCKLTSTQTQRILDLLRKGELYLTTKKT